MRFGGIMEHNDDVLIDEIEKMSSRGRHKQSPVSFIIPIIKDNIDILDFKFEGDKEFISIPAGTAHYLEHKMFEQPDGTNSCATEGAYSIACPDSKKYKITFEIFKRKIVLEFTEENYKEKSKKIFKRLASCFGSICTRCCS